MQSNSTSIAITELQNVLSNEVILQGKTPPPALAILAKIFESYFLIIGALAKIYSFLCWPHKRSQSCLDRTSCSSRQKSQMVLIDLNKCWSEQWSRIKESDLIMRGNLFVWAAFPFLWNKFITSNYLGSFVKATATRREEITYILSKFMRTMFTEPLQNNRFSPSFVFGNKLSDIFLFGTQLHFASSFLFLYVEQLCPDWHWNVLSYSPSKGGIFSKVIWIWNKICLLKIVSLHNLIFDLGLIFSS